MNISSQHHSFDILLAAKFGVEESILIHHFQHWIRINRYRKRNIRDDRCWSYQSRKDIQAHFPYWNVDRVKYLCEKLVFMGVLMTANFNKNPIDKTLWYAFVDEKTFGVDEESSNIFYEGQKCPSMGKSAQPIPDTRNTDTKNCAKAQTALPKKMKIAKEKKEVEKFVCFTDVQLESLIKKADGSEELVKKWCKILSEWKIKKSIEYRSNDYAAIINWVIKAEQENKEWKSANKSQTSYTDYNPNASERVSRELASLTPEQRLKILNG